MNRSTLTAANLVNRLLQIAVTILDGLLQVAQGAMHTTLGYGEHGCLLQDVAAAIVVYEKAVAAGAGLRVNLAE